MSNLGVLTLELSDKFLFFDMESLNKTLIDMYVIPNEVTANYSMNFTWTLIEFSSDHRRMIFQLEFFDPLSISPNIEQDHLVFHIKDKSVAENYLKC